SWEPANGWPPGAPPMPKVIPDCNNRHPGAAAQTLLKAGGRPGRNLRRSARLTPVDRSAIAALYLPALAEKLIQFAGISRIATHGSRDARHPRRSVRPPRQP